MFTRTFASIAAALSTPARHAVIDPAALAPDARAAFVDTLFACHQRIFAGVDRAQFAAYVVDSPAAWTRIFVLRDRDGALRGYGAFHLFHIEHAGQPLTVVRMEAGFERGWRSRAFHRFVLAAFARARLSAWGPMYFVCCPVHPSSFVSLARHAPQLWTLPDPATPAPMRPFMRALAGTLGLEAIGDGVYRIGWITRDDRAPRQISDEATRYMRANPGYRLGHGLFTVIPVSMGRVMRAGLSVLAAALRRTAGRRRPA